MGFIYAYNSDSPKAGRVEVSGHVLRETEKAVQFSEDGAGEAQWLPKRFLHVENLADGSVIIDMPQWLARAKRYV